MSTISNGAVREVALARRRLADVQAVITQAEAELQQEYADVYANREQARERLAKAEADLRASARAEYEASGNKHLHPAVNIRMVKRYEFDAVQATAWALQRAPDLLVLDATRFKKVGPELGAPIVVTDEPQVTLASDLTVYLLAEEEQLG